MKKSINNIINFFAEAFKKFTCGNRHNGTKKGIFTYNSDSRDWDELKSLAGTTSTKDLINSGLTLLLEYHRAKQQGCHLAVVNPSEKTFGKINLK